MTHSEGAETIELHVAQLVIESVLIRLIFEKLVLGCSDADFTIKYELESDSQNNYRVTKKQDLVPTHYHTTMRTVVPHGTSRRSSPVIQIRSFQCNLGKPDSGDQYTDSGQTSQCSFSAVSKPMSTSKFQFCSILQDLSVFHFCTASDSTFQKNPAIF